MKQEEKGFRQNFQKFRTSAKNVPCDLKLPLFWDLVMECVEKDKENEEFVRERWRIFTIRRIQEFDSRLVS